MLLIIVCPIMAVRTIARTAANFVLEGGGILVAWNFGLAFDARMSAATMTPTIK
jgi:hypothetical protein